MGLLISVVPAKSPAECECEVTCRVVLSESYYLDELDR